MADYLIVPGLNNSGPGHWQTHWEQRLHSAVRVEQKYWDKPDIDVWADEIALAIKRQNPRWIIAHSFGCLSTLRALTRNGSEYYGSSVEGLFFVAPADPDKFVVRHLLPKKALTIPTVVVGSKTDPWFGWEKLVVLAKQWQVPLFSAGDAGHINIESGHGDWQDGWNLFQQFQKSLQLVA